MLNEKVVPPALVIARLLLFCYSERGAEREGRRKEGREMMERNDGDRKRMGRDRQTDRQGQRWRERVRDGGGGGWTMAVPYLGLKLLSGAQIWHGFSLYFCPTHPRRRSAGEGGGESV